MRGLMRRWLGRWSRRAGRMEPAPMPVVVGSPRSGTTLLRLLLDAHPQLAIPPETGFLGLAETWPAAGPGVAERVHADITGFPASAPGWQDFGLSADDFLREIRAAGLNSGAEVVRLFYRLYAARFGKPRWGEKTPLYCLRMAAIERLLPEARFIHIIRDGRDAALSLRPRFFSPGHDIEVQARYWRDNVEAARQGGGQCRHYLELHYESLLRDTERELRRICDFIELDFHPDMLRAHERAPARLREHHTRYRDDGSVLISHDERVLQQAATMRPPDISRIGVWRREMSGDEVARFEQIAGPLLRELGYPLTQD